MKLSIPVVLLLLLAGFVSGCTSYIPKDDMVLLPCDNCGEKVKLVTIPLPVIASTPNEGITMGGLGAFLFHDKNDEITTMLAPQVNHNKYSGVTTSLYGSIYPKPERNFEFNLSYSTKINYDYELRMKDTSLLDKKLDLNLFAYAFADGSARFYGFHANSSQQMETNYTSEERGYTFLVGYKIADHLQLILGNRFRDVDIRNGAVTKVPATTSKFSVADVPGLDGFTAHANKLGFVYSTLDNRDTPTSGYYGKASVEQSLKALGSSADYRHYEAEVKGYIPLDNARYISVFRLMYNQTLGNDVPFLERSILGGENSLRGYGRNRFIDSSFLLCNLEERIRLFRWQIFNVTADWEIAPFVDLGAVMESLDKATIKSFEFNPGVGFRAIVRPNIVGRVDLGVGKNGPAIFVGLGYPF